MALNAYLTLKGQKSGQIKGSVTQKGREDSIMVIDMDHSIVSPRDPQSGLPTGQRMHKPFVFTKELDKSTPILFNVLCTNENLTEAIIKFYEPAPKGVPGTTSDVHLFTVKLTNVSISSIQMGKNTGLINHPFENVVISHLRTGIVANATAGNAPLLEEVSLTYRKIEWTWVDGGITAQDDWEARK